MEIWMIRRREFIAGLGSAAAWPVAARAQGTAIPVIGVLGSASPEPSADRLLAFRQGLSDTGYVVGRNVALDFRWAYDQYDRLPGLAVDLVGRQVSLIVAMGNVRPALAAKSATTTIPVVFTIGADPVRRGVVPSFNRPGGNVTGHTSLDGDVLSKRLQLLHDLVPDATRFGALVNPNNPSDFLLGSAENAAWIFGGTIEIVRTRTQDDFEVAFATLVQRRIEALIVFPDTLFVAGAAQLVALPARHGLPTNYFVKDFAKAGGLITYSAEALDRQAGIYAGRILKGERPGDLPVVQPTKFELVINLKTAKALGLTIPETLLATADELIQ
jgi:putative tryptophan/tyrosine transport system substrate-binding protein